MLFLPAEGKFNKGNSSLGKRHISIASNVSCAVLLAGLRISRQELLYISLAYRHCVIKEGARSLARFDSVFVNSRRRICARLITVRPGVQIASGPSFSVNDDSSL